MKAKPELVLEAYNTTECITWEGAYSSYPRYKESWSLFAHITFIANIQIQQRSTGQRKSSFKTKRLSELICWGRMCQKHFHTFQIYPKVVVEWKAQWLRITLKRGEKCEFDPQTHQTRAAALCFSFLVGLLVLPHQVCSSQVMATIIQNHVLLIFNSFSDTHTS